ncbi:hypothetical protein HOF56_02775, partial [Candidatus Peribacteria bacterium]|nr:hypothetical protein [Candidatus Peribacteria bacterium]
EIAQRIKDRLNAILINSRSLVDDALSSTIQGEIESVSEVRNRSVESMAQPQRTEVVMEAVRNSLPNEVVRELLDRFWPSVYRLDTEDYPVDLKPSDVVIKDINLSFGCTTVIVDADHAFWKGSYDRDEALDRMTSGSFEDCGIRLVPDVAGRGSHINKDDAKIIYSGLSTEIYVLNSSAEDPIINNFEGYNIRLKFRNLIADLSQSVLVTGRSTEEQNALNSADELEDYLKYNNPRDGRVWDRFVDVTPNGLQNTGTMPAPGSGNFDDVCEKLAERAFRLIINPIGRQRLSNIANNQHSLHKFSNSIRNGDINAWDAATAMAMIQQDGALSDVLGASDNSDEMSNASRRLEIIKLISSLEREEISPVSGADWTMENLKKEETDIPDDIIALNAFVAGSPITLKSLFAKSHTVTVSSVQAAKSTANYLANDLANVQRAIVDLDRVGRTLTALYLAIKALPNSELNVSRFGKLVDLIDEKVSPVKIDESKISVDTNIRALILDIKSTFPQLKTEEEYRADLKSLQESSSSAPQGASAIYAVYQSYFKGKGLNKDESQKAANELMARNAMDMNMDEIVNDATRGAWGPEAIGNVNDSSFWEDRIYSGRSFRLRSVPKIRRVINSIAGAFSIPVGADGPILEQANFEQLLSYYYALKSRVGASTERLHIPEYHSGTHEHMRTVSALLAKKHAKNLLYSFKGRLPEVGDDKSIESVLGQQEKLKEVLASLLRGDAPEIYVDSIRNSLARADKMFEPWRRVGINGLRGTARGVWWAGKGVVASDKNPVSLKNIFYNYPVKLAKGTGRTAKKVGQDVVEKRKPIALAAVAGAFLGFPVPLAALAGYGATKFMKR